MNFHRSRVPPRRLGEKAAASEPVTVRLPAADTKVRTLARAAVWLAYAVFFWDRIRDILADIGFLTRHQRSPRTIQFKEAAKKQAEKARRQGYRHKCEVCGRTDADHPELSFRYCSRCAGYHCFCEDHIFNHEHFTS